MDLELGHGFIPRIGEENYKAVDRCVGPADLFNPDPLDLPWAIIDGAWAERTTGATQHPPEPPDQVAR